MSNNNNNKVDPLSLYIGSKGENANLFKQLVDISINASINSRIEYNYKDPSIFNDDYLNSNTYKNSVKQIKNKTEILCNYLKKSSQCCSLNYQAHMVDDPLIPSFVGTIAGLLHNSNNVSPQGSIKSAFIEHAYNIDICKMIGYDCSTIPDYYNSIELIDEKSKTNLESKSIYPFAHNTSCGTLSNIESCWASFWVKFIPVASKNAILNESCFNESKENLKVLLCDGKTSKKLIDCSNWELSNLNSDVSVNLPYLISQQCNLFMDQVLPLIKKYHICTLGNLEFFIENKIKSPVFIVPSSAHYSFNKSVSFLGLGSRNFHLINVESNGRMNIDELKNQIDFFFSNEIPIINVVGIMGSTQEYAVDNMEEIVLFRNEKRKQNFNFDLHVDGAFGGYSLSCIRDSYPLINPLDDQNLFAHEQDSHLISPDDRNNENDCPVDSFDPELIIGEYLKKQMNACKYADTFTIDGHKSGFLPFSNSVVCFRNSKYKDILSNAGVYNSGGTHSIPYVGIYGLEGSKPGYNPISSYLTHSLLRPTKLGYGKLLKRCILNTKIFFIKLLLFFNGDIENRNGIKAITFGNQPSNDVLSYLKSELIDNTTGKLKSLKSISSNHNLLQTLSTIGPDLNGVCFCFNYYDNSNYLEFIEFNKKIIQTFDYLRGSDADLIFSNTSFNESYGNKYITNLLNSIGLSENIPQSNKISIPVLRSTIMSPFIGETNNGSYIDYIIETIFKEIKKILN